MSRYLVSNAILIVCMAAALLVLLILGTWQVQRLQWKEALIAEVEARLEEPPLSLDSVEQKWAENSDVDYFPVSLSGTFRHDLENHYYNTLNGAVGWNVITPLELADGRHVLVNRGFIPDTIKEIEKRRENLPDGVVEIEGLARNPVLEKPNSLIPDNDLERNQFFWKSHFQMVKRAGTESATTFLPFMVDAGEASSGDPWPKAGTTRISFPNNHLQYAVTWYGLAITLILVGGYFLWSRRRSGHEV